MGSGRATPAQDNSPHDGRYRYVDHRAWWTAWIQTTERWFAFLAENHIETWIPADESAEWLERRTTTGRRKWLVGTPEEAAAAGVGTDSAWPEGERRAPYGDFHAAEEGRTPVPRPGTWGQPTNAFLVELPRTPDELHHRLLADTPATRRGPAESFLLVASLLRTGRTPNELHPALHQALTRLPGLRATEGTPDLDGREGTSLAMDIGQQQRAVVVDPETSRFLGERGVITGVDGPLEAGTVTKLTSLSTAVVDQAGLRPPAAQL